MVEDIDMGEFGRHLFQKLLKTTASEVAYTDVLDHMQSKNAKKYTDETFPPNEHSLITDWDDDEALDKVFTWRRFTWARATDIPSLNDKEGKLQVFSNKIEPSDIKQGALGDCYFLSVLSVLSEDPQRIKRLFKTDRMSNEGVYCIEICKNGTWREVVIDDYFPCDMNEPVFSHAHGNELWVMLLEKAWAKLHGSYERIEAGLAENVFRDLTGAPASVHYNDDDDLWERMLEAEQKKFVMAASAGSTAASQQMLESVGLIGQHAYGCLGVIEVTNMFGD